MKQKAGNMGADLLLIDTGEYLSLLDYLTWFNVVLRGSARWKRDE